MDLREQGVQRWAEYHAPALRRDIEAGFPSAPRSCTTHPSKTKIVIDGGGSGGGGSNGNGNGNSSTSSGANTFCPTNGEPQFVRVTIVAANAQGVRCTDGTDFFLAVLRGPAATTSTYAQSVRDNHDGTYTATFRVLEPGTYHVDVLLEVTNGPRLLMWPMSTLEHMLNDKVKFRTFPIAKEVQFPTMRVSNSGLKLVVAWSPSCVASASSYSLQAARAALPLCVKFAPLRFYETGRMEAGTFAPFRCRLVRVGGRSAQPGCRHVSVGVLGDSVASSLSGMIRTRDVIAPVSGPSKNLDAAHLYFSFPSSARFPTRTATPKRSFTTNRRIAASLYDKNLRAFKGKDWLLVNFGLHEVMRHNISGYRDGFETFRERVRHVLPNTRVLLYLSTPVNALKVGKATDYIVISNQYNVHAVNAVARAVFSDPADSQFVVVDGFPLLHPAFQAIGDGVHFHPHVPAYREFANLLKNYLSCA
jgi:hypothetical protein